jgi:hypothetical protein
VLPINPNFMKEPMANDKTNETLTTYVSDVHALVAHGIQAITAKPTSSRT